MRTELSGVDRSRRLRSTPSYQYHRPMDSGSDVLCNATRELAVEGFLDKPKE